MKNLLTIAICLIMTISAYGQEKFTVPERTPEQKHQRAVWQLWSAFASGIHYAKSQGATPYDYGKYIGDLFAQSWNKENGFDGFANGMIFNWESFRTNEDEPINLEEKGGDSVIVTAPLTTVSRYFPADSRYAAFEDATEFLRGVLEPIADYMSSSIDMKITDESIIYTIKKK